jgi:Fe-S-cluster containining protein
MMLAEKIKTSYKKKAMLQLPDHPPSNMCIGCGNCCKRAPGIVDSGDIKHKELIKMLDTGRYTIDYWEQDGTMDQTYFIRPAIKGHEGKLVHAGWGGACTFLTDKGCELPLEDRPANCRQLKPKTIDQDFCVDEMGKQARVFRWTGYQDLIEHIIRSRQ